MLSRSEERREYNRNWMQKRRKNYINILGGKCVICNTKENLEFHHVDKETKEYNINAILSYKFPLVIEELAKCELRCKEHHKEAHEHKPIHGTRTAYSHGCKCLECCKANTQYRSDYRKRTGRR